MTGNAKVIAALVIALLVLVGGAMLLSGLIQGDEVDREENPVQGRAVAVTTLLAP